MSLRRQFLRSFAIQGAGSASVLLATLWLGARLGPEVQGGFSRTKAEIEFIAAIAMFGLPQSLFFHVNSGRLSGRVALRWALSSALLALPVGLVYGLAQPLRAGLLVPALLGAAVAGCVAHGQLRALLLVRESPVSFNVLTALPQVLVLAGVGCVIGWGAGSMPFLTAWWAVFAVAFGTAAVIAWRRLSVARNAAVASPAGWREIGHYGLATWIAAILSTAASLVVQRWVEGSEGPAALGRFTLAMTLVLVPLTPIAYVTPLLFRRWMERPGADASQRWAGLLFAPLLGIALLAWLAAPLWPDLGLGPAYAGVTRALAVLLVGGAAEAASRLLAVQTSARGRPWVGVGAEVARWSVLALGWLLPLPHGLLPLCAVWAAAAGAAALVFVAHARADAAGAGQVR